MSGRILKRPASLTPDEDVPPPFCSGCGLEEPDWEYDEARDAWRCGYCRTRTFCPDPSDYRLCPDCNDPFPLLTGTCKECGTDWSDEITDE